MTKKTMLDRIAEPKRIRPGVLLFNVLRCVALIVVQALAARTLDGVLALALWVNAAYNTVLLVMLIVGLVMVAAEASKRALEGR